MKKTSVAIIIGLVLVAILATSVYTILTNEKYQAATLVITQGYELVELTDESITFETESKCVTYYDFGFAIEELSNN